MASASSIVPPLSLRLRRPDFSTRTLLLPPFTATLRSSVRQICTRSVRPMAMAQQSQGPLDAITNELDRPSAKDSLLLAIKNAGGFEALVTGKTIDVQVADVAERIKSLERLNPTPEPATSPLLEGNWNLGWFAAKPSGLFATSFVFEKLATTLAHLTSVEVLIKDGSTKDTVNIKLLDSMDTTFVLSSKLSAEGPVKMLEESVEGLFETPSELPAPIRDLLSSGITIPMKGTITRRFMISYLDDEILIIRDSSGLAEILTRLKEVPSPGAQVTPE